MTANETEVVLGALAHYPFEWWFMNESYAVPGVCEAELVFRASEAEALEHARNRLVASGFLSRGELSRVHTAFGTSSTVFPVKVDFTSGSRREQMDSILARRLLTEALGQGPMA